MASTKPTMEPLAAHHQKRLRPTRHHSDLYHPSMEAEPEMRQNRDPLRWHLHRPIEGPRHLAIKNHFIAMIGEYVGTTLFLLFALGGTNVANIPTTSVTGQATAGQDGSQAATANTSNLLYIALSFGFSLAVNAWIFFRVSGGLFNPAVSLAMVLVGALEPLRGALLTISQILGGITGAAIVSAITPGTLNVRTQLGGGTSIAQGLFIEMFLTSLLMLAILLLAAEKHKATFIAPIGIGLALFVAELLGVYYTGGSLNPARSFGPDVVLHTFSGYHWIYWLGPILGSTLAAGFYKLLKWLQYETVLGPEDSTRPSSPTPGAGAGGASGGPTGLGGADGDVGLGGTLNTDGEKKAAKANANDGPKMVIQGPGMDRYLTSGRGNPGGDNAWHLGAETDPALERRLDKIEALLHQLVESDPRLSTSTVVDDSTYPHSRTARAGHAHPLAQTHVASADYARSPGAATALAAAPRLSDQSHV